MPPYPLGKGDIVMIDPSGWKAEPYIITGAHKAFGRTARRIRA